MEQNMVIDLVDSSDDESSDDELGEVVGFYSGFRRERSSGPKPSQSQEHPPEGDHDSLSQTRQDTNESEDNIPVTATSGAGDEDDDSVDHYELRSLEVLRNHCWACHLWVHHPALETDENSDEICFNALHLHPILDVPVCVVCAETIEAVERNQQSERSTSSNEKGKIPGTMEDVDKKETSKVCFACGAYEDCEVEFIRCDGCPRLVCPNCYQQARHSIKESEDKILVFTEKKPPAMSVPRCLCCSCLNTNDDNDTNEDIARKGEATKTKGDEEASHALPAFLRELQRLTKELFSPSKREVVQTLDDVLVELETLEAERQQCELNLDDPKHLLETIRVELLEEFSRDADATDDDDDDDIFAIHVQNRYQECYEKWHKHLTRVMDRIAIVNDRIKAGYGIEAFAAFRYIKTNNDDDDDGDSIENENGEDSEPLWKVAADHALAKREKEERLKRRREQRLAQKSRDNSTYLLEITEDAEELGSSSDEDGGTSGENNDEDEADAFENGWRNAPLKAQKLDIDAALRAEDKRRIQEGKTSLIRSNKISDKAEIKEWDSGLKSSAMRIRKKTKKRKRELTRTLSVPPEDSPSKAIPVSALGDRLATTSTFNDPGVNVLVGRPKALTPSSFVLSKHPFICIAEDFDRHLKEHQREGIRFMYKNTFADLANDSGTKSGGCILAHSMGLGKSLSCVSLLYAIMMQPSLVDSATGIAKINKTALVVPVNTLANWENEFDKWTKQMSKLKKLPIFNVSKAGKYNRDMMVRYWSNTGGILLTSIGLFRSISEREDTGKLISDTDAIVLDESHTMLKNKESKAYKAFMKIKTPRRICLTGTPFQNNLMEYYRMVSFIRPNLLGNSENKFQKEFIDPINAGVASDASDAEKASADNCLARFANTVEPYIHRRDASLLRKHLPSLQQVCLYVPPTKIQRAFYKAFRGHQERTNEKNFLKHYAALRTIHNHPGTLLFRDENGRHLENQNQHSTDKQQREENFFEVSAIKADLPAIKTETIDFETIHDSSSLQGPNEADAIIEILSSDEEEDCSDEVYEANDEWWTKTAKKFGAETMKHVESGNKCIILLHILMHASMLGEKTIVFSQSLKTLDFLTELLASKDWQALCPSLRDSFQGQSTGGWIIGKDFLRIDGGISGAERGELLQDFSDDNRLKLFLISSVAGGIGINLVSASRVILFDSHFNPTIDLQAIFRCYRYGQTRDVFAYRLLTQGTMEEKVFSRAMNKTSIGNRLIDGKKLHRCFEKGEIDSLTKVDDWVECTKCRKWRMFPPDHTGDVANIPEDWRCELMNKYDARMTLTCSFEEKSSAWYYHHFKKPNENLEASPSQGTAGTKVDNLSTTETEKLVEKDDILKNILTIRSRGNKPTLIVSKHYFHDTLLADTKTSNRNKQPVDDEIAMIPKNDFEAKSKNQTIATQDRVHH